MQDWLVFSIEKIQNAAIKYIIENSSIKMRSISNGHQQDNFSLDQEIFWDYKLFFKLFHTEPGFYKFWNVGQISKENYILAVMFANQENIKRVFLTFEIYVVAK